MILAILVNGHLKTVSVKYYSNLDSGFEREDFLSLLYSHIRGSGHAPWRPFFSSKYYHYFSNLGRRSPEDYFCLISFEFGQWFWRKRFSKFSIYM